MSGFFSFLLLFSFLKLCLGKLLTVFELISDARVGLGAILFFTALGPVPFCDKPLDNDLIFVLGELSRLN